MINFSKRPPSVSVVMPVFNGGQFLAEAINSIINQTFQDFEFIIIDDCSTDQTDEILDRQKDRKIKLVRNPSNIGNYASRNIGMDLALGRYICVMDADDVAFPHRLHRQFAHMETNPDVGICGSFIQVMPNGGVPNFVTNEDLLKVAFLSNNYCSHPSLILRKEFLNRYKLNYNEEYYYSADFDLCARGFQHFRVQNIPDVLLQYRRHATQISTAKFAEQQYYADTIRITQLVDKMGFKLDEIPAEIHLQLMKRQPIEREPQTQAASWVNTLIEKNKECKQFDEPSLSGFLKQLLTVCCNFNLATSSAF